MRYLTIMLEVIQNNNTVSSVQAGLCGINEIFLADWVDSYSPYYWHQYLCYKKKEEIEGLLVRFLDADCDN